MSKSNKFSKAIITIGATVIEFKNIVEVAVDSNLNALTLLNDLDDTITAPIPSVILFGNIVDNPPKYERMFSDEEIADLLSPHTQDERTITKEEA